MKASTSSFKKKVKKAAAGAGGLALLTLLGIILFRKPGTPSPPPLEPPPGSEPGNGGFKMPVTVLFGLYPSGTGDIIPVPQPPFYDGQTVDFTYYPVGANQFDHWEINQGFEGGFTSTSNPYRHTVVAKENMKEAGTYYNIVNCISKSTSPVYALAGGGRIAWQLKL